MEFNYIVIFVIVQQPRNNSTIILIETQCDKAGITITLGRPRCPWMTPAKFSGIRLYRYFCNCSTPPSNSTIALIETQSDKVGIMITLGRPRCPWMTSARSSTYLMAHTHSWFYVTGIQLWNFMPTIILCHIVVWKNMLNTFDVALYDVINTNVGTCIFIFAIEYNVVYICIYMFK